jgi:hypothetical protein
MATTLSCLISFNTGKSVLAYDYHIPEFLEAPLRVLKPEELHILPVCSGTISCIAGHADIYCHNQSVILDCSHPLCPQSSHGTFLLEFLLE